MRDQLMKQLESRLKEVWGQLNNYVDSENEKHFRILLAQIALAQSTLENIRMTTETQNLHECIQDIHGALKAHHEQGDWEAVTNALDGLREAFDLIHQLRD